MRRTSLRSIVGAVVIFAVLFAVTAAGMPQAGIASIERPGVRSSAPQTFQYLVATGPLCDLPLPDPCPAISMAENGDTVEITGSGTFGVNPKSATGGGDFTHKDSDGNVIGEGTWEAVALVSFVSYGNGVPQDLPENFYGGKALLRVQFTVGGNVVAMGVLTVYCTIGSKIPAGAHEGVRLVVQDVINFNKQVSGLTLFILE